MSATACYYCGMHHEGVCARVSSVEYYPDGTLKRVTFRGDALVRITGITLPTPAPSTASEEAPHA